MQWHGDPHSHTPNSLPWCAGTRALVPAWEPGGRVCGAGSSGGSLASPALLLEVWSFFRFESVLLWITGTWNSLCFRYFTFDCSVMNYATTSAIWLVFVAQTNWMCPGINQDGVTGAVTGLAKGIIGTVAKPAAGLLDFASGTTLAITQSTRSSESIG